MYKFKRNDKVKIIKGKDKGKESKITKVLSDKLVVLENINIVKKHVKPSQNKSGGIIDLAAPISASNIRLLTANNNLVNRIHFKMKDGKKYRVDCKSKEFIKDI